MITTTNNVKKFFENETGKIIIYGAGGDGYWIGKFMNECNIPFECSIDSSIKDTRISHGGGGIYI